MFQFNFELEDDEIDEHILDTTSDPLNASARSSGVPENPCVEISVEELLLKLPSVISYSPLEVPSEKGPSLVLSRRDLFDARFQLVSRASGVGEDEIDDLLDGQNPVYPTEDQASADALRFVDAPSDLVRGVYEGGLKTWECSIDLASYLIDHPGLWNPSFSATRRTVEIGCGTGIPSAALLHSILNRDAGTTTMMEFHLQDYNRSVLELVTVPNLFLAWYTSTASEPHRDQEAALADPSMPGEVELTPELRSAFLDSLTNHNISLRFFAGGWTSFSDLTKGTSYDLVLSSETIYEVAALPTLVKLFRSSTSGPENKGGDLSLENLTEELTISTKSRCLVAAKVLYFGVGGGIPDFKRTVEGTGGKVQTIWERKVGVGRQIMSVEWDS